ncbi:MAG: glycosyltransferase family 9 protein [Elusimicrobia bacterium]|nr:glycosyltransferase family 9 protein [Elusimicrobiota bacterium]
MDVLIVKLAALGDVLRTTSVARRLRACRPEVRIVWVTSRAAAPLLQRNADLAEVLALEDTPKLPRKFDLVLSLEEDAACARLATKACRGELIGVYEEGGLRYTPSSGLYYDMSALHRDPDGGLKTADRLKAANRLGYAQLWCKVLGLPAPGRPSDLRPVLVLSDAERKAAARGLCLTGARAKLTRAIGFNPGAGKRWEAKQLSPEPAARVADALAGLARPVVLLGGPEEAERNRRILALARRPLVDAGTARGLREFAALLSWFAALVTTDSLAFHLGQALGVPTVVLVGPTSASELELFARGTHVRPKSCACFYKPVCVTPPSCLDRLSPARIAKTVERLLA